LTKLNDFKDYLYELDPAINDKIEKLELALSDLHLLKSHTNESKESLLKKYQSINANFNPLQISILINDINTIKQKIANISLITVNKITNYDEATIDEYIKTFKTDEHPVPMQVPEKPQAPVPIPDYKARLERLKQEEVATRAKGLKLKQQATINPDIIALLKFNESCECCSNNKKTITLDKSNINQALNDCRDSLNTILSEIKTLETHHLNLENYNKAMIDYENLLKIKEKNDKIILYHHALNDKKYYDNERSQKALSSLKHDLLDKNNALVALKQKQSDLTSLQELINILDHNESTIAQINKIKLEINTLKDKIQRYNLTKAYNVHHENSIIKDKIKLLEKDMTYLQEYNELQTKFTHLSLELDKFKSNKILNDYIQADMSKLLELETKTQTTLELIKKYKQNAYNKVMLKRIEINESNKARKSAVLDQNKALARERKTLLHDIQTFHNCINTLKKHDDLKKEIETMQESLMLKTIYKKHTSINHGISNILLNRKISELQEKINETLDSITDFYIKFDINDNSEAFLSIVHEGQTIPATQGSGFQKFIISLAIRLVLAQNHPFMPGFLIIDEGFGCMDSEHLSNTVAFLSRIKFSKMDWLMFVSHLPEMRSISGLTLEVKRNNGVSNIVF